MRVIDSDTLKLMINLEKIQLECAKEKEPDKVPRLQHRIEAFRDCLRFMKECEREPLAPYQPPALTEQDMEEVFKCWRGE